MEKPSIADTISQYLDLKRSGKEFKACCPFHEDKHPSFSVNEDAGVFYCFGCGVTGDVFDFLMKWSGKDFKEVCGHLGIHGLRQRIIPDDTRTAARKIALWAREFSLFVADRLIEIGQQAQMARDIMREPFVDVAPVKAELEILAREWAILETLHEDLVDPEQLLSLYEHREMLEGLVDDGATTGTSN